MGKLATKLSGTLLAIVMALSIFGAATLLLGAASPAYADNAKADGTSVLTFTSDIHNGNDNTAANRLDEWFDQVKSIHGEIDVMSFCGDMGAASAGESQFWSYTQSVMNVVDNEGIDGVYTTGNHEFYNGQYSSTSNSVKSKYLVGQEGASGSNYRIYCMGTANWNNSQDNFTTDQITALTNYLNSVNEDKTTIVLVHFPLHRYSSRATTNADRVIDALNAAANEGKKIVLLWGHNHTMSDSNYDQIFSPGDTITYNSSGSSKQIQFYYGAAGCMSDSEYGSGSAYVKGKGLVITINNKNQLSFTYYDAKANNVTENGSGGQGTTLTEQDPTPAESISVTPTELEIEVGRSSKLTVDFTPADTTNKRVTWTSSNTSVATVTNGKVKGVSQGEATITATSVDGGFTAECTVTVIPRTSEDPCYVIKAGDYVLSTERSNDESNGGSSSSWWGSSNTYTGLVAVADSPAAGTDEDTRWLLEETGGGYYIKSLDGRYLNATYSSSGSSWNSSSQSDLKLDETPDVWVLDEGVDLDSWEVDGSYLMSTNSERYLCEETGTGGTHLFSVRSKDNADETTIEEASDPVAVTDVTVSPATETVEAKKTVQLTATVTPSNATNKTVLWSSSNTEVATVNANGRVRGVAEGTATITATTEDGNKTATATITVTASSSPEETTYVITIDGYALSTDRSPNTAQGGNESYTYTGLAGVAYDAASVDDSISWIFEETDGGYYIKSLDGKYLNATYDYTSSSGKGDLKLDDTPDIWTFDAGYSIEDTPINGSYLKSTNASGTASSDKYLGYEDGDANLFTVRSKDNADTVTVDEAGALQPQDDPTANTTVDITPSTDNPEESASIKVGETLTINVTNGSTRSDYDFTASLSDSEVAKVQGSATVNIAASGIGQFTVEGVAAGTVDITIQNENSSSSQYTRKGVVHLTVSEDGSTPDDPPVVDETAYKLVDSLTDGKDYLIVSSDSTGSAYALTNPGGSSSGASMGSTGVTVLNGDIDGDGVADMYITTDATSIVWTATANGSGFNVTNGGDYLEGKSGNVKIFSSQQYDDRYWTYSESQLKHLGGTNEYTVYYNGGFTSSYQSSSEKVYIYEKTDQAQGEDPVESVTLNKSETILAVGETEQLAATVLPATAADKSVTWTSSDDAVATVSEAGLVTAVGEGAATITVTTVDGEKTATCEVTVTAPTGDNYKLVDSLTSGKEYLVVSANTAGSAYALANPGGTSSGASMGSTGVTVLNGDIDGDGAVDMYITTDATNVVWTATANGSGFNLTNGSDYLEGKGGNVRIYSAQQYGDRYWTYSGSQLQHVGGTNTYTVYYSNGFTSASSSSSSKVYIYEKVESTAHTHSWNEGEITTEPTCTEEGEKTLTCSGCGETKTESIPALGHDFGEWTVKTEPTCTEAGVETHTCSRCDASETREVAATGHKAGEPVRENEKAATCTAAGSYDEVVYCTACNAEISREAKTIEALGHDYESAVTEPTCTKPGFTTHTCSRCGDSYTSDEVEALGHDYVSVVTEPTCTETGFTTHTCSRCGDSYTSDEVAALGHVEEVIPAVAATCTEPGATAGKRCSVCDETLVEPVEIPALGHSEEAIPAVAATCDESGLTAGTKCSRCGEILAAQEEIPALGHEWNAPTYTWGKDDNGEYISLTAKHTCTRDASHVEEETVEVSKTEVIPATDTEEGKITYTSAEFENPAFKARDYDVTIPATGHELDYDPDAIEWDWTGNDDEGYTAATATVKCKHFEDDGYSVSMDADVTSQQTNATCTDDGAIVYTATAVFEGGSFTATKTVVIEATGHVEGEPATENVVLSTCAEAGSYDEVVYCTVCNAELSRETKEIEALGHAWSDPIYTWGKDENGDYVSLTAMHTCTRDTSHVEEETVEVSKTEEIPATCTEDGKITYTSAKFKNPDFKAAFYDVNIPALGHAFNEWTVTTEPTCTEAGTETRTCSRCGEVETREVAAIGHAEEVIPAVTATCTETGLTEGKKCSVCGEVLVAQEEVAALGHDFGEWTVTKKATESAAGEKTRKCSRCDATETKAIPKLEPAKPDPTDPTKKGEDGTAFGPGASAAAVDKAISKMTSDADPAGSAFAKLKLVSKKQSKTSVTISWTKVSGAASYVVYGNQCGSKNKMKKIATVSASKAGKKFTKVAGKKVKAGKSYKFLVVALDKNGMVVTSSKVVHAYAKGGKYTNHKSVKVKVGSKFVKAVTVKKGKTVKLQGVGVQAKANAGFKFHTKNGGMRFESTNKKVAAVSAKGVVKGKAAGTCYVYVYSQNGVAKKVKVTVK